MTLGSYLAFIGLCAVLSLTPGPDTLLVLRYSVRQVRVGIAAAVGCTIGVFVWAGLVGFGLAALIEQSAELFRVLKVIGGLYLLYLGIQAIRQSRKPVIGDATGDTGETGDLTATRVAASASAPGEPTTRPTSPLPRGVGPALAAGLLSNITNPKVGLFFLAVVPQFLPNGAAVFGTSMLLGATLGVVGCLYLLGIAAIAAKATAWLKKPRVTKYIERISGSILGLLGIGTAASAIEV